MRHPVVFIPGFPGTNLFDELDRRRIYFSFRAFLEGKQRTLERLLGPDDPDLDDGVTAIHPVAQAARVGLLDIGKQAKSLYEILRRAGFSEPLGNLAPVGWDWRKPTYHAAARRRIMEAIETLAARHRRPVVVIANSAAGLVFRSVVESEPAIADRVHRLIAFGIPWAGTLKPLRLLLGRVGYAPLLDRAEARRLFSHSHGAFDLLPPDPAKTDMSDDEGPLDLFVNEAGQASPLVDLRWAPEADQGLVDRARRSDRALGERTRRLRLGNRRLPVTNIVGWGFPTRIHCRLDPADGGLAFNRLDRAESNREGDGTVARRSAAWLEGPDVSTLYVPIGHYPGLQLTVKHATMWRLPAGREILDRILLDRRPGPHVHAAVDSDDAVSAGPHVRVRVAAQGPDGAPLADATARLLALSPDAPELHPFAGPRLLLRVPRDRIRQRVGGSQLLRFQVEVAWSEDGRRESLRRTLIVQRT